VLWLTVVEEAVRETMGLSGNVQHRSDMPSRGRSRAEADGRRTINVRKCRRVMVDTERLGDECRGASMIVRWKCLEMMGTDKGVGCAGALWSLCAGYMGSGL